MRDLNLSCPAVSHSWIRNSELSTVMFLERKSMPMVGCVREYYLRPLVELVANEAGDEGGLACGLVT